MKIFNFNYKIILQIFFVIIILSTSNVKSLDKFDKADLISDYFSGILHLNDNQYDESFKYFKKLNGLEKSHTNYSVKYLYSLINSGNFNYAFRYSIKLEKQNLDSFESHLIVGIYYLKNSNLKLAQKYFLKAKNKSTGSILNNYISDSLLNWSNLRNLDFDQSNTELKKLDERFKNFKKIQNIFLNCFFNTSNTENLFMQITNDKRTDFSRYNFFYASYLSSLGKLGEAKNHVKSALVTYPRNLLLNQYNLDLKDKKNVIKFDCKKEQHVIAEILYITSNALSSQLIYSLSNFYLNLSKFLNEELVSYDTLLAENYFKTENFEEAKKIYYNLSKEGEAFKWYTSKQLAKIYLKEENQDKAIKVVSDTYKGFINKNIYDDFDYAEFLKNNEKFKESILYYSKIIKVIKKDHPLYAEVTDGRGVAYERTGEWDKAEKDLLASLKADPDQAYVINYLAYSWIEQGIKIEKSLSMLEKANDLRSNDPYIIDSLGWALFKLKRYKESKDYLQTAVRLMPGDPVVNDHYGDVLWKNGNKIQARYYWEYVLNLKNTKEDLKKNIEEKLIKGL